MKTSPEVSAYIATFPRPVQARLRKVRAIVRKNAPAAEEVISYRIPGPKGNLKFSHADPLPLALIARIVRLRVRQDSARKTRNKRK